MRFRQPRSRYLTPDQQYKLDSTALYPVKLTYTYVTDAGRTVTRYRRVHFTWLIAFAAMITLLVIFT